MARGYVRQGNTPTSVGKTHGIDRRNGSGGKHPHERGEDDLLTYDEQLIRRNTPTSVGKTLDFTGVDGGLVEIRFVALSVFQSQGACLKFQ